MIIYAGIIAISISAVLYTTTIWGERFFIKELNKALFVLFAIGFLFDLLGTGIMTQYATINGDWKHIFFGRIAILIMAIHFVFACFARKHKRMAAWFHNGSMFAVSIYGGILGHNAG